MARIMLTLIIVAALVSGCGMLRYFRVSDVFPAWRDIPAVEMLEDGVVVEWHDFAGRC